VSLISETYFRPLQPITSPDSFQTQWEELLTRQKEQLALLAKLAGKNTPTP
jgi:hypothetical protein